MNIVAIDPGLSGAIAIIDHQDGSIIDVFDMPIIAKTDKKNWINVPLLFDILSTYYLDSYKQMVVIEQVHSMPKQGVSSVFSFGENLGAIRATSICAGYSIEWVTPPKWKKHFNLLNKDKKMAGSVAVNLYSKDQHRFVGSRGGVLDGRSDAVLLARYIYDKELNK